MATAGRLLMLNAILQLQSLLQTTHVNVTKTAKLDNAVVALILNALNVKLVIVYINIHTLVNINLSVANQV